VRYLESCLTDKIIEIYSAFDSTVNICREVLDLIAFRYCQIKSLIEYLRDVCSFYLIYDLCLTSSLPVLWMYVFADPINQNIDNRHNNRMN